MAKREIVRDPIVEVFDDFDDKPLPGDTKPARYQFNGITYDLYLSNDNKGKVDKFIKDLTTGAEKVKSGSGASATSTAEKARRKVVVEAYNKANPDKKTDRYAGPVKAWEASNK